jgi:6-phosphofructokinase 1
VDVISSTKKLVDVKKFYNTDRLRPNFDSFEMKPLFIMTSEG